MLPLKASSVILQQYGFEKGYLPQFTVLADLNLAIQ